MKNKDTQNLGQNVWLKNIEGGTVLRHLLWGSGTEGHEGV